MRLGAVDFLPKPTTPGSLRTMVADVLARRASATATARPARAPGPEKATSTLKADAPASSQAEALAKAKQALNRRAFEEAEDALHHVNTLGRSAEAYYLLGVLHEMRDDRQAAYNAYRSALQADPNYEPARLHLMKYFGDPIM
jgi:chemotaxis protein methyltransferase WspC